MFFAIAKPFRALSAVFEKTRRGQATKKRNDGIPKLDQSASVLPFAGVSPRKTEPSAPVRQWLGLFTLDVFPSRSAKILSCAARRGQPAIHLHWTFWEESLSEECKPIEIQE